MNKVKTIRRAMKKVNSPKKLRHFPTKQGRINIKVEEIKRESE